MVNTYSPASTTNRDRVRRFYGDTDTTTFFLHDTEVDDNLLLCGNVLNYAAAMCADQAAAQVANRKVDVRIGQTTVSWSQMVEHLKGLADRLRKQGTSTNGSGVPTIYPIATGLTKSEAENLAGDEDARIIDVQVGQDDHPGLGNTADDGLP